MIESRSGQLGTATKAKPAVVTPVIESQLSWIRLKRDQFGEGSFSACAGPTAKPDFRVTHRP